MNLVRVYALLGLVAPLYAQYGGPAILLRGEAPAPMTGAVVDFRPFLEVGGSYTGGLSGVSVTNKGTPVNDSGYGAEVSGGVSGVHSWKHLKLGLDYRGSYRHLPQNSFYDGTNQSLMLGITDQLTRHTVFTLRETAGLASNNFSQFTMNQAIPFDPATSFAPTNDFYDNRTIYLSTQADVTIQKSARLSLDFGADGFLQRRRSSALYGVTGAGARADAQYRLTRRSTIGVGYIYTHYSFTGIFSSTDLHGAVLTYGNRLSRNFEFTSFGGFLRAETKFVQTVPIDPAIAALIGISTGTEVAYRTDYVPNLSARLSYTVRRGVFYISGGRTITPGNGVFLTSTATRAGLGYAYTGFKHWSFNASAGYSRSNSLGNVIGRYGGYQGSLSASRQLFQHTHGILSGYVTKYDSPDFRNYNRWTYSVRLGIGFTPGDYNLRLW